MSHNKLKNINYVKTLEFQNEVYSVEVLRALDKLINMIKEPDKLFILIDNDNLNESIVSILSSICILLGETNEIISEEIDVDELSYQYMTMIRKAIQQGISRGAISLFGGYADIGLGVHALYKSMSHYKKFLESLNELIVNTVFEELKTANENISDVRMQSYDTITGLSGVTAYLMLYKHTPKVKMCIKEVLKYFVLLTQEKEVYGIHVPNYYISSENQFIVEDKEQYKKGNFNQGLSHGIAGPLMVLTLALREGVEVDDQKQAIKRILNDLMTFSYIDENGSVYFPGRIRFEDYISRKCEKGMSRASWCYGTPGIARVIYLAGNAINDVDSIQFALKAIDGLCNVEEDNWMLDSPTICHGYGGLLAVIQAMYMDRSDTNYKICIDKLMSTLLDFYNEDSLLGFMNVDLVEISKDQYGLVEENKITFLEGAIGVVLAMLSSIKPIEVDWMRHLLID